MNTIRSNRKIETWNDAVDVVLGNVELMSPRGRELIDRLRENYTLGTSLTEAVEKTLDAKFIYDPSLSS